MENELQWSDYVIVNDFSATSSLAKVAGWAKVTDSISLRASSIVDSSGHRWNGGPWKVHYEVRMGTFVHSDIQRCILVEEQMLDFVPEDYCYTPRVAKRRTLDEIVKAPFEDKIPPRTFRFRAAFQKPYDFHTHTPTERAMNPCQNLINRVLEKKAASSDCTLKIAGADYPCHTAVLIQHPYFEAKLEFDQSENPLIVVDGITSSDAAVLLLRNLYLYEIDHEKLPAAARELIEVASEMLLEDLNAACGKCLEKQITIGNSLSIYVMSDRMKLPNLKLAAQKYIMENFDAITILTDDYGSFLDNNKDLVTELIKYSYSAIKK